MKRSLWITWLELFWMWVFFCVGMDNDNYVFFWRDWAVSIERCWRKSSWFAVGGNFHATTKTQMGFPSKRDSYLGIPLESQTTNPNHQLAISPKASTWQFCKRDLLGMVRENVTSWKVFWWPTQRLGIKVGHGGWVTWLVSESLSSFSWLLLCHSSGKIQKIQCGLLDLHASV